MPGGHGGAITVGRDVRIQRDRGKFMESRWAKRLLITTHPSALLRLPDRSQFDVQYSESVRVI